MKLLAGLILSVIAHCALAQSVELHVMLNGSQREVDEDEVMAALTAVVESSTVDVTRYIRPAEGWDEALAGPGFIHALFSRPRQMKVWRESDTSEPSLAAVREIVIVLPGLPHILLKTDDGVHAITKYSPCSQEKLITAARLDKVIKAEYLEHLRKYCQSEAPAI